MRTKHLFVLIDIRNKGAVDTVKYVKTLQYVILMMVPMRGSFCESFCYLSLMLYIILSCLFLAALWSPAGKELTSWFSCIRRILVFLSLSHIVSWARCGI